MKHNILTYILPILLALLTACSTDNIEQGSATGTQKVRVTISTRATGTPEAAQDNNEKIHTWWIAIVNKSTNKIVTLLERSSGATYITEDTQYAEFQPGHYTMYAFANITQYALSTIGYTFAIDADCPITTASTINLTNGHKGEIPMSGKCDIEVTTAPGQQFDIEVVRMYAKMEFQYKNLSNKDVTVNSISIKQVQPTSVPLLPDYTWLDNGRPYMSTGTTVSTMTHTYTTPLSVTRGASPVSNTFYMIESLADYDAPSNCYTLTLNIRREGATEDENLYFMLDNSIQTIYRNDHIVVPITITDYIVSLDADFYPPIGGYPAIITEDKDKEEFYCTFKTQGEFSLLPTVQHSVTYSPVYYPYWDYASTTVTVTGDNIFDVAPHIDLHTGELLGKLSTAEGTACISITIKVRTAISPEVVYQTYPRKIYIIRKN